MKQISSIATALLLLLVSAGCSQPLQSDLPAVINLGQTGQTPSQAPSGSVEPEGSDSIDIEQDPKLGGSDGGTSRTTEVFDYEAEIEIEDQSGDGKSIEIREISVSLQGLLLVIFDNQKVVAQVPVSPTSQPVTVLTEAPILSNGELIAFLFKDNGNGVFDNQDLPVVEKPGDEVHEEFFYRMLE